MGHHALYFQRVLSAELEACAVYDLKMTDAAVFDLVDLGFQCLDDTLWSRPRSKSFLPAVIPSLMTGPESSFISIDGFSRDMALQVCSQFHHGERCIINAGHHPLS